jgi:Cysteine-rich secretory protein family
MKLKFIMIFFTLYLISLTQFIECSFKKSFLRGRSKGCNVDTSGMTPEDKRAIITFHNKLRNQIATQKTAIGPKLPYATNMIQMYYSESLGAKAQEWADNCSFSHSDENDRKQPQFNVGENIYRIRNISGSPSKNWQEPIEAWFSEVVNFGGKTVTQYGDWDNTKRFTQLIWAYSYFIGCGFSSYVEGPGVLTFLYVCHYGPKGNISGMPIYNASLTPGCLCPGNLSCNNLTYSGLCCPTGHCNHNILEYNGEPFSGTTLPQV